jgi:hypothetical protein
MSDSESQSPNRPCPLLSATGELSAGPPRDALGAILGETLPVGGAARDGQR